MKKLSLCEQASLVAKAGRKRSKWDCQYFKICTPSVKFLEAYLYAGRALVVLVLVVVGVYGAEELLVM